MIGAERQSNSSINRAAKIVVLDAFTGGGAQADQLRIEFHAQLADALTYVAGKHIIKGGISIPDFSRRGLDNNLNSGGTFYFSDLPDYLNQRPFSFIEQVGSGHDIFLQKRLGIFIQDSYHPRKNLMLSAGIRYDWENYYHDNLNFSPRFSLAYSPGRSQKTIIRGGTGVFYDRIGQRIAQDVRLFNGSRLQLFVLLTAFYSEF